ncbi:MAG: HDOD domain-containing protein [Thiohalomonadales bacterium]
MSSMPAKKITVDELAKNLIADLMEELESDRLVLPSLPEVALRVRDTIDDPNANSGQISKVISTDAGLTARLIQVANTPLVRGNRKIDSIDIAITRMGNTMVKNVVSSLIVQQMFQPTTELSDKKLRKFWEHSTEVAAISHALAGMASLKPDLALLAGLVHDIGALPVIKAAEDIPELLEDEAVLDEVIAQLHRPIGTAMLTKWNFEEDIIAVADSHEQLDRVSGEAIDYVDIVMVANLQSYLSTDHHLAGQDWSLVPAFAKLGLSSDVSIVDIDDNGESINEVKAALRGD